MSFIKVISPQHATGRLQTIYQRIGGTGGQVDNVLQVHSLRPHTLEGHMALYKAVLHHSGNKVPVWFLESLGLLVSELNRCNYCARHHTAGLTRELAARETPAVDYLRELRSPEPGKPFSKKEQCALRYARQLTRAPASIQAGDIQQLRDAGWSDGEVLEINQVTSYFAYANRTVTGLGVVADGEVLGLSPSEEDSWSHS